MGSRFSASTAPSAEAASALSAKVITVSGTLKEYAAAPVPASLVLIDCESPNAAEADSDSDSDSYSSLLFFLCNADALSFDAPVQALAPDDPVLPGRLYFVLPDGMQRRPLSGTDMGALAVRASKALEAAAGGRGGRNGKKKGRALKVSPVIDVVIGKEQSFEGCYGADRQRTAVGSSAARLAPAQTQLMKSAAVGGQRRGAARGWYVRRGGSFRGKLGTIQEDAE